MQLFRGVRFVNELKKGTLFVTNVDKKLNGSRSYNLSHTSNIFDSQCKALQRRKLLLAREDNSSDQIKSIVGKRMSDAIYDIKKESFEEIVELWCDKGYLTEYLPPTKRLHLCDIEASICDSARNRYEKRQELRHKENIELGIDDVTKPELTIVTSNICAIDEVDLCLKGAVDAPDLIVSNLMFHWINNIPILLQKIHDALCGEGDGSALLFSMFTQDCLFELRVALQMAEANLNETIYPHIPPQLSPTSLIQLLEDAGFLLITVDIDNITMLYPDLNSILEDLKNRAETNCTLERPLTLRRDVIKEAEKIYRNKFGIEQVGNGRKSFPLTYKIACAIAWKVDPKKVKLANRQIPSVHIKDISQH